MGQKISTMDLIVQKLEKYLDRVFWDGKGDRKQLKEKVKALQNEEILSKKEYDYFLKNERPILIRAKLIHLLPELQSQTVLENTLSNIATILLENQLKEGKKEKEALDSLVKAVKFHLEQIFHPALLSLDDGIQQIINLISNSKDISRDYMKISELLQQMRDELLERGESRRTVYEIDKLSKKFANLSRTNPLNPPKREELIKEIKNAIKVNTKNQLTGTI